MFIIAGLYRYVNMTCKYIPTVSHFVSLMFVLSLAESSCLVGRTILHFYSKQTHFLSFCQIAKILFTLVNITN
jgi:hypothetical protein